MSEFIKLSDEEIEKAEAILAEVKNPEFQWNKYTQGCYYVGVTGKYQVFYTLYRFKPSTSPYVEPYTYICNLSTDLIDACVKAKRVAGNIPVDLDTVGTCKKLAGAAKKLIVVFGKYRGKNIEEIFTEDPNYVLWMKKSFDQGKLSLKGELYTEVCRLSSVFWEGLTKQNEETSTSEYVGTIGERLVLKVRVISIQDGKIKLVDDKGNRLYTFTDLQVEKDQELTVKGTVKKHTAIVGIKQTYLNRIAII